jgi:hypothetical protein
MSSYRKFPPQVSLEDLRNMIDMKIFEFSIYEFKRSQIPCGYHGTFFCTILKSFFNDDEIKYLKSLYAEHHELYMKEELVKKELFALREAYEAIESTMFAAEKIRIAKLNGVLPIENKKDIDIPFAESYDEEEAFGPEFDWIA